MSVPPEQLLPMLASAAAGLLMLRSGTNSGMLRRRRVNRRCPSCDRHFEGRVCRWCADWR